MGAVWWARGISVNKVTRLGKLGPLLPQLLILLQIRAMAISSVNHAPPCAAAPTLPYAARDKISQESLHLRAFSERLLLRKASIPRKKASKSCKNNCS